MGQVRGSAVLDDEASDETSLKLGFPLSRGGTRLAPAALTNDKPTVKSSGQKLSMSGLLHVLWDRAELTHWHPKIAGKRTWFVVGEIKEIVPAHGAEKIVLRHVGDMPFVMDQDMARRFHKRFAGELALWQAQEGPNGKGGQLVLAGSFARHREGTFDLIEVALTPATGAWLPYETGDERYLVGKAVAEKRRFVKGLRVNLDTDTPIASLVLKDTGEEASAIHIHDRDSEVAEPLEALLAGQGVAHLLWKEGEPLPARVSRPPRRTWQAQESA